MTSVSRSPYLLAGIATTLSLVFSFLVFPGIQEPFNLNRDPDRNGELGANLYLGNGFVYEEGSAPAVDRGPVYPFFLAAIFSLAGGIHVEWVFIAQAFCFGVTTILVYSIAKRVSSERVALAAQVLCALHPLLIWYTGRIWIESLHTLLVTATALTFVLLTQRPTMSRAVTAGVVTGFAILTKSILILFPILFAIKFIKQFRFRRSLLTVMIVVMALCIVPWTIRNFLVSGHFVPVHVSLGLNLTQGNAVGQYWLHEPLSNWYIWHRGKESVDSLLAGTNATETDPVGDRMLVSAWIENSISDPGFFVWRSITNLLTFWYLSESPAKSLFLIVIQLPLVIGTVIGSMIGWRRIPAARSTILLATYYVAVHAMVVGWARYSAPIIPVCLVLCAYALLEPRKKALPTEVRSEERPQV